jgi:hypothetical protein
MLILASTVAGTALAADDVRSKEQAGENYCHEKIPAIRPRTLASDHPTLKGSQTGDVIDYYGPCDESPTGANQVLEQKHEESFMFGRQYEDGD